MVDVNGVTGLTFQHTYTLGEREVEMTIFFTIVDIGIGNFEFWGCHMKDEQLVPEILDIYTDDNELKQLIDNERSWEQICENLYCDDRFLEGAEELAFGDYNEGFL